SRSGSTRTPRSRTTSPTTWCGEGARRLLRVVVQVRGQQPLGLLQADTLAPRVVGDLFLRQPPDHEVLAARMAEVPARHRRRRIHREMIGEGDAGVRGRVEQAEQGLLLAVLGAGRVARGRADA